MSSDRVPQQPQLFFDNWQPFHRTILAIASVYASNQLASSSISIFSSSSPSSTVSPSSPVPLDHKLNQTDPLDHRPSQDVSPEKLTSEDDQAPSNALDGLLRDWHCAKRDLSQAWLGHILNSLKLDQSSLPHQPTEVDLNALADHLPPSIHAEAVHDLILLTLSAPHSAPRSPDPQSSAPERFRYTALDRQLIFSSASALRIPASTVYGGEKLVAQQLFFLFQNGANHDGMPEADARLASSSQSALRSAASQSKWLRYVGAGAGVLAGGVAIGLTGGLAAPVIAPMLVGLSGGALGFLATSGGAVLIGTLFGLAGGGLTGYRAQRRLKGIEEFSFERLPGRDEELDSGLPQIPSLHATIVCSGFLLSPTDYKDPWTASFSKTSGRRDVYAIKLETAALLSAGKSLESYVRDTLLHHGATELIKRTALASFYTAVLLPASIYKAASMALDNEYQRVRDKCQKAGILLADMIEQGAHGARPLTLIGSSMGAITVFEAILELSRRRVHNAVDQLVLIGAPLSPSRTEWMTVCNSVSRRVVNVYSKNDWVLAILARLHCLLSTRLSFNVAGLVDLGLDGVESIDVSDLVLGHLEINSKLTEILERVGIEA